MPEPGKPSPSESLKEKSNYLRDALKEALSQDTTHFTNDQNYLLKFHGVYQQDDRDKRQELLAQKKEAAFSMMVRSKIPGGRMSAEQYLVHDKLADQYGNKTLRITNRQGIQFHGVLKKNMKAVIRAINEKLGTTSGACGDIVRNVLACPAPHADRQKIEIQRYAKEISDQFLAKSGAYYEIWLNGEPLKAAAPASADPEPIFGKTYLPRKFKIAIAFPDDNCIDVLTDDIGIVPEIKDGKLTGFNIFVGGGFGTTHGVATTYPRLGSAFCFVQPADIKEICKAIVLVQRDNGNRSDRKRARLKYLLDERGLDWFRAEVEKRYGKKTEPVHEVKWKAIETHLGWQPMTGGKWYFGLSIENGRIKDEGDMRLKTALRTAVEKYRPEVYLTAQQDVLLAGFAEEQKKELEEHFTRHGVKLPSQLSNIQKDAMACPALPTCGLAITESERVMPSVVDEVEKQAAQLGLAGQRIMLRMTGCPNGCARPYNAEIAFVGRTVGTYAIYLGGNLQGNRLNFLYKDKVPYPEVAGAVGTILKLYVKTRLPDEGVGDFCSRLGAEGLQKALAV